MSRGRAWPLALLLVGCNTAPVAQRILLAEQSAPEPPVEHETMPLGGGRRLPLGTVAARDGAYVGVQPPDLSTATGRTVPSLVFGAAAAATVDAVISEPWRVELRRMDSDSPVEVDLTRGSQGYGQVDSTVVVLPREPLRDGWYSLNVDLPLPLLGTTRGEDGRALARFRRDSHPVVQRVDVSSGEGSSEVSMAFSELVLPSVRSGEWRFFDGRGELRCAPAEPVLPDSPLDRLTLACAPAVGHVRVDFGGPLHATSGAALRTWDGEVVDGVSAAFVD